MYLRLIRTDMKRTAGYALYMVISAVLLMTLLLCLALNADDIIYSKDDSRSPLAIGIVMNADSTLSRIVFDTIQDMDSYSTSCEFTEISDKSTALSMLDEGELYAVIIVPDNIINDIIDGTNTPVEVYYSDDTSLDTFVINDLFRSTSSMLGISQAAIYSVQAAGADMGLSEELQAELSDDINTLFLKRVLLRASEFAISEVNATNSQNTSDFYMCAALITVMNICGLAFISFVRDTPMAYRDKLRSYGIVRVRQASSSFISIFVWEYILYLSAIVILSAVSGFADDIDVRLTAEALGTGLWAALAAALLITLAALVPVGTTGCIIALLTVFLACAYLSGFIVPETMLPNFAEYICGFSPYNRLAHAMCDALCMR